MVPRWVATATWVVALTCVVRVESVHAQSERWRSLGPEGGAAYALAIDPRSPSTLYAGTKGGVFKSDDGGSHWSAINAGLPTPVSFPDNGGPYIYSLAI